MPIAVGARLGPYEIVSALGAGGMGEVYKARDTRLDRVVAIKVLPAQLAGDPQFRERFEREARTISHLDHPHICALYDVGEHEGTSFLVMQYLEGETLADRMERSSARGQHEPLDGEREARGGAPRAWKKDRPLPMNDALSIAIQIADALDKAHRAGIVHRDLKPSNIMIVRRGGPSGPPDAKLLDFGLAKTAAPAAAGAGLSMLPTTPPNLTAHGAILGTFQYMAPEQIEGEEADARTDLFALGVVLYEMLTGKRAFSGKTPASLFSAILKDEPPPISLAQPLTPPALDRVVKRCLAKDRDQRWQTAADLLAELRWIAESGLAAPTPVPSGRSVKRLGWLLAVIGALAVGAAIGPAIFYLRNAPIGNTRPIRFIISPPQNVTFGTLGGQYVPAVSPDGRRIAFLALRGGSSTSLLWVRALDAAESQPLLGTEGATRPFWSPDSRSIAFIAQGRLKIIDASGGPTRTVCDVPPGAGGGAWNADGVIVFGSTTGGLFRVLANGGVPTLLTHSNVARGEIAHRFPGFLPDGRHVLYVATPSNTVWLAPMDGSEPRRLFAADSQAEYVAPGFLLFVRQGTLLAQPFDAQRATLTGEPIPVAEQVLPDPGGSSAFSASVSGVLAYRTGTLSAPTRLTWFDRAGKMLGALGQPGSYRNPNLSPDGTRVAVEVTDPQTLTQDIWLMDVTRGVTSRFTFDPANDIYPIWSPDGNWIVFGSDRGSRGLLNLYQKRANGSGNEELLLKSVTDMAPLTWSPDGRALVYRTIGGGGSTVPNLGILPLVGERTPRLFESSKFNESFGQVSPDGRWLAYRSQESRRNEVYVQSFPTPGGGKWQISKDGGTYPRWRRDGRELFYYRLDRRLMAVSITSKANALEIGAETPLFELRTLGGPVTPIAQGGAGFLAQYDVTRDGQRFLVNVPLEDTIGSAINVVANWQAGLKN